MGLVRWGETGMRTLLLMVRLSFVHHGEVVKRELLARMCAGRSVTGRRSLPARTDTKPRAELLQLISRQIAKLSVQVALALLISVGR